MFTFHSTRNALKLRFETVTVSSLKWLFYWTHFFFILILRMFANECLSGLLKKKKKNWIIEILICEISKWSRHVSLGLRLVLDTPCRSTDWKYFRFKAIITFDSRTKFNKCISSLFLPTQKKLWNMSSRKILNNQLFFFLGEKKDLE